MIELAFSVNLINSKKLFWLTKKANSNDLYVHHKGMIFYCRQNTTDILHLLPSHERQVQKIFGLKHGIFIDVGAHVGSHTLRMATIADHVYAFEPTPSTYNTLLRNIYLNNISNVTAFQLALSHEEGKTPFYINEINTGENSLNPGSNKKFIWVKTKTFDNII